MMLSLGKEKLTDQFIGSSKEFVDGGELRSSQFIHTVLVNKKGKLLEEEQFDKSSARIAKLVNKSWLSRYPRSKYVIYDNGSEFKLHFESLCDDYGIERKPTTIKNPQANAILETGTYTWSTR